MDNAELAWAVEEACANAWPASRQVLVGGWLLRAAGGPSRRINSVNPLRGGPSDPAPVIAAAEAIYGRIGQPALFRVPDLASGMDAALASAGYGREGDSGTLVAGLGDAHGSEPASAAGRLRLVTVFDEDWLAARLRITASDAAAERALRETFAAMLLPHAFAASLDDKRVAAVAFGAIDRDLLVIEAVATDPACRRLGLARAAVTALMDWARSVGASRACLQVDAANGPARCLYAGLGFGTELYRYHYRRQPRMRG